MPTRIQIGDLSIELTRKDVKHVHLSVHPPDGRVTLVAPKSTRPDVARAYAISKLSWIRNQQVKLLNQARETPRAYIERESHYLWGRRYLLTVDYQDCKPKVVLSHNKIQLVVRPNSNHVKRAEVIHQWHKALLHQAIPPLIAKWQSKMNVAVKGYYLQRMKTKWGSCNHRAGHIRLNTELVKKPKDLLEYVIVHEVAHLLHPTHNEKFIDLLNHHYPTWREARLELNQLPLAAEKW
jgi:predicted metal-dependent hydrolase